ncbi:MAG: hypothetical protein JWR47_538, partial [Phenylobacterium sp.]|nr:hypothetical protein [Phenylobacterium sp.]
MSIERLILNREGELEHRAAGGVRRRPEPAAV